MTSLLTQKPSEFSLFIWIKCFLRADVFLTEYQLLEYFLKLFMCEVFAISETLNCFSFFIGLLLYSLSVSLSINGTSLMTASLIILIKLGHSVISFTKSQTFVFSSQHVASYGTLSTPVYSEGTDLNATPDFSTNIIIIVAGTYQIDNEHFL